MYNTFVSMGTFNTKRSPKVFINKKKNAYEGELSLVANQVKRKKKSYAVQKKVRLVVMGVRG